RNSICRPETSRFNVVDSAVQLSRPVVTRVRGRKIFYGCVLPSTYSVFALSGSWTSGLVSHTSLSDSLVTHPSFCPISGETGEYMIFGRIGATGLFIQIFIWA
ncbi:hypothetical protein IGI04_030256, partial [Brassica rapa subsp. trilocularis]